MGPMTDTTTIPTTAECPFGVGAPFEVEVPTDVLTPHGNVQIPAGTYWAWQAEGGDHVTAYAEGRHYAGASWVSVMPWDYCRPGATPEPVPAHDCSEHLRSTVVGSLIVCGLCRRVVEA